MADGSRQIKSEQVRTFQMERSQDGETVRYTAALSSELPVERWFGTEILSHAASAVNLERCRDGLQMLFNHDMDEPLGRVQNVRLEGGKLRGELVFGTRPKAQEMKAEVDAGMLRDISIRYSIDEYETKTDDHGHDTVTITRWTVMEASVVTVPADPSVGIGRSSRGTGNQRKERTMAREDEAGNAGDEAAGTPTVADLKGRLKRAEEKGAKQALRAEQERVEEIQEIFSLTNPAFRGDEYDTLRDQCIRDYRIKPDQARKMLMELIDGTLPEQLPAPSPQRDVQNGAQMQAPVGRSPLVQAGATAGEKLTTGIQRAIEFRSGLMPKAERDKERAESGFTGHTLVELAREWCVGVGIDVRGRSKLDIVGMAFTAGRRGAVGMGTVDFAGILANVANKALLAGWEEAPETWATWCRKGNLSDFKRTNRTGLSQFSRLDEVKENGEYKYGKQTDRTEYIQLITYGKLFAITRQAIINDDLGAFTATPRLMGRAATGTVGDAVYNLLTTASGVGPTLNQDSLALFHSTHANYTASTGAPAVSTLDVGRQAMALQTDPNTGVILNIRPKYALVPVALETSMSVLVASEIDPIGRSGAGAGARQGNPFYKKLEVVAEGRLDGKTNGTTAWYLLADQNLFDTFEVAFLDGQDTPFMESRDGWSVDGVEYKVRIDAGVGALDFRGMYRCKGA